MNQIDSLLSFLRSNRQRINIALYWLIFVGFIYSRVCISLGMIGIVLNALLNESPRQIFRKYTEDNELLVLSVFFWIVFLSCGYSDNKMYWLERVRIKLPFLFLPFAFAAVPHFTKRQFQLILSGLILVAMGSACLKLGYYFQHYAEITFGYSWGKSMPVKYGHIRYSLLMVMAFFSLLWLVKSGFYFRYRIEKALHYISLLFLFVFIHILSVRSGLVALYLGSFVAIIYWIVKDKQWLLGTGLFILLTVLPIVGYKTIPSFRNKVDYTKWDWNHHTENVENYSDGMRLLSDKVGLAVFSENPMVGVGAGDLPDAVHQYYRNHYANITHQEDQKLPHNQFIWVLASNGFIGLIAFLFAFFFSFYKHIRRSDFLFGVFYVIIFTSFLTEHTIEEQIGTGFYVLFLLLFINFYKEPVV